MAKRHSKQDLIEAVAARTDSTKGKTEKIINATLAAIMDTLAGGDAIQLIGFGTFEVRTRSARKGKNPQTGEEIDIPEQTVPAFKPGTLFKKRVSKG